MASEHANTMLFLNVIPDMVFTDSRGSMTMATTSRKLKVHALQAKKGIQAKKNHSFCFNYEDATN